MAAENESRVEQAQDAEEVSAATAAQGPVQEDDEDEVEAHVWRAQS